MRLSLDPHRSPSAPRRPGFAPSTKLWLALAALAVVALAGSLALGGLGGQHPAVVASATPDTGYLARGYADLDSAQAASSGTSMWGLWLGMLIPLAIVIGCIYLVLRGLKFVNARVGAARSESRFLESIDALPLGQQGAIHLVRVGTRLVVVGAGSGQITLLAELTEEQAAALIEEHRERQARLATPPASLQSFRDLVRARVTRPETGRPDAPGAAEEAPTIERLEALLDQLRVESRGDRPPRRPR